MKIFLDDLRETPPGWPHCFWPEEVIELLKLNECTHLSLDHDLGDDSHGDGYDVLLWIEEQAVVSGFTPPIMKIHSANSAARERMQAAMICKSYTFLYKTNSYAIFHAYL